MEWFASTIIVLGIGVCDGSADWCGEPVGKAAIEQSVVESGKHSAWLNIEHFSEIDEKDFGGNLFLLEYRFKLR